MRIRFLLLAILPCLLGGYASKGDVSFYLSGEAGVYHASLGSEEGQISEPRLVAETSATFLALHPSKPILYTFGARDEDYGLVAFQIDSDGSLVELSFRAIPLRGGTHLALNSSGTLLAVASWGGGKMCVVGVASDGSLDGVVYENAHFGSGSEPRIQSSPHPHWVGFSRDGRFLFVTDMGTDEIWIYAVEAVDRTVGLAKRYKLPDGFGPRHLSFSSDERYAFVSGELKNQIAALGYEAGDGSFSLVDIAESMEPGEQEFYGKVSEVVAHPRQDYAYIANRGHDTIAVFRFDREAGKLQSIEREPIRGAWPRHFGISPDGRWLLALGMRTSTVASFRIREDGTLAFSGNAAYVPRPSCVVFR